MIEIMGMKIKSFIGRVEFEMINSSWPREARCPYSPGWKR